MKNIILMRHAKSNWADVGKTDHQRTLNTRGERDAPTMAQKIAKQGIIPDLILLSDSQRTKETWELLEHRFPNTEAREVSELYLATADEIVLQVSRLDDSISTVMVLAHNPGITEAFYVLGNVKIDNVPTAGVGCFNFDVESFSDVQNTLGELAYFTYPKLT